MRSSTGQHFVALDHIRALAAFMVVCWHFLHFNRGIPVPFEYTPAFPPFALLDEGHTGVALFMVLSGYLFAKLLDGRRISFSAFLWNRFIRLAPLLGFVFLLVAIDVHMRGRDWSVFVRSLPIGFIWPTWPNGGWSVATEIHFYLVLPLLLALARRAPWMPLLVLAAAVILRGLLYADRGEVHYLAYWTIVGRIDQFVLGVVAFHYAPQIARHKAGIVMALGAFVTFWWWFDYAGGFFRMPSYPSPSAWWIGIPTFEGIAYGTLIAWYDQRPATEQGWFSRLLQRCGEYSYSIYLLHFFIVFRAAYYVHFNVMDISNFYLALPWATLFFLCMLVPGYLSFRYIESPFLRLRKRYVLE